LGGSKSRIYKLPKGKSSWPAGIRRTNHIQKPSKEKDKARLPKKKKREDSSSNLDSKGGEKPKGGPAKKA